MQGVLAELSNITAVHRTPSDGESIVVFVDALQLLYSLDEAAIALYSPHAHTVTSSSHAVLQKTTPAHPKQTHICLKDLCVALVMVHTV